MKIVQHSSISGYFGHGTSQQGRVIPPIHPSYVKLDDRQLKDILSFSVKYAETLRFYDANNQLDGNFEEFYLDDVSSVIALILTTDVAKWESEANTALQQFNNNLVPQNEAFFEEYLNITHRLLTTCDKWYKQLRHLNAKLDRLESAVETEFYNILNEKIVEAAQLFSLYVEPLESIGLRRFSFEGFDKVWQFPPKSDVSIFKGKTKNEQIRTALTKFRINQRIVFQGVYYIQYAFEKYFYRSVEEKNNHQPQIGLYITFLKLFRYAQTDLNNLTSRVLHFYYGKLLQQKQRVGITDKAHICLQLIPEVPVFELPEGTSFVAGINEDGKDITYSSTKEVQLTQAQIEQQKTLFISRLDEVDTSDYHLVTAAYSAEIANSADGEGATFDRYRNFWPLLGEEQEFKPDGANTMSKASIGFAISSPMFYLQEGERNVSITLNFEKKSTRHLKRLILNILEKENQFKEIAERITVEEVFYKKIFNQGDDKRNITIWVSTKRGWMEVPVHKISIKACGKGDWTSNNTAIEDNLNIVDAISIKFLIPNNFPAVVECNERDNHDYRASFPVVKIVLDDSKRPYSYSFLHALQPATIDIGVQVKDVKKLQIHNDYGILDNRHPFAPFGYQPKVGSNLIVGYSEMFRKPLSSLQFNIKWKDIPKNVGAFVNHYAAYKMAIVPNKFRTKISTLVDRDFIPMEKEDGDDFYLFTKESKSETSIEKTEYWVDNEMIKNVGLTANPYHEELPYDNDAQTGFFKLELTEPKDAFGHEIYPKVYTDLVMEKMKEGQGLEDVPGLPYTPMIQEITLDYSAESSFDVLHNRNHDVTETIYHVHPFGVVPTYKMGTLLQDGLLPYYEHEGYLFLGLSNVKPPETISILFQLSAKNIATHRNVPILPKVHWYYLSRGDRWKEFSDEAILQDTTDGFTKTGILTISIPRDMNPNSTLIKDGLFWLRASVERDTHVLCACLSIHAQALEVIRDEEFIDDYKKPLAPMTIEQLLNPLSEILEISQPYESFEGKRIEGEMEFFARVSERLRHKQRAICHWDYETLILEQFPEVQQAKCLSAMSHPIPVLEEKEKTFINIELEEEYLKGVHHSEGIVVVVVPQKSLYRDDFTPNFNLKTLKIMEQYLGKLCPPFVNVKVRNPLYEYVRVIANVLFEGDGSNNGFLLQQLKKDIRRFIAPWIDNPENDIPIGGNIALNIITDYVKSLPYIRYLTKFSLLHIIEEDGLFKLRDTAVDVDEVSIIQSRPWGVLVPDEDHELTIIYREEEEVPEARVNSNRVIRFQNRVNILGGQKYVKIRNPKLRRARASDSDKTNYSLEIQL